MDDFRYSAVRLVAQVVTTIIGFFDHIIHLQGRQLRAPTSVLRDPGVVREGLPSSGKIAYRSLTHLPQVHMLTPPEPDRIMPP
jgi:hypothetical protein